MSSMIFSASFLFTQRSRVESWLRLYKVPLLRKNLDANLLRNFLSLMDAPFRVFMGLEVPFYFIQPWFLFRLGSIFFKKIGGFVMSLKDTNGGLFFQLAF